MQQTKKPKIIIVVGTTASGKSALSIELARKYNGEVISADSRQVYRKLDIGTAKVTHQEMRGVPHHLIDIVDLDSVYTAVDFKRDAQASIEKITNKGNVPIITGGTFFYIDALLERSSMPEVPPDSALRADLEQWSPEALYERLQKLDPRRAKTIDAKNKRRLIRALEIVKALGTVPESEVAESPYDVLTLGIVADKEELRKKFGERARAWLQGGFKKEVRDLLDEGIRRERLHEVGFEYQLGLELIDGSLSEDEFIQRFVEKNWQYAKRQTTWLKRDQSIIWVYPTEQSEIEMLIEQFLLN